MELKEKEIKEEIEKNRYKLLGQISVLEKNYEDLIQYIKKKIKYKGCENLKSDLIFSLGLVQVALKCYEGNYWETLEKEIEEKISLEKQGEIGTIFLRTLNEYKLLKLDNKKDHKRNKYVENIKMHTFVTNNYIEDFLDFSFEYFEKNLLRQLEDEDNEILEDFENLSEFDRQDIENKKSKTDEKTLKIYKLKKSTKYIFAYGNPEIIKDIFYPVLKMIDRYYYDNILPKENLNRFEKNFIEWSQKQEIEGIKSINTKRKSYSFRPFIKLSERTKKISLIIPKQKIRKESLQTEIIANVVIKGEIYQHKKLDLYTVNGMILSEECEIEINRKDIFSKIEVDILNKKYDNIKKSNFRIFNDEGIGISKLEKEKNILLLKENVDVKSLKKEDIVYQELWEYCKYIDVTVDENSIFYIDNKKLSINAKNLETVIFEKRIDYFSVYNEKNETLIATKSHPVILFEVDIEKLNGIVVYINQIKYNLKDIEKRFIKIDKSLDNRNRQIVRVLLDEILYETEDGEYVVELDIPGEKNIDICRYMLLRNLEFKFDKDRYIYEENAKIKIIGDTFNLELQNENNGYEIIDKNSKNKEYNLYLTSDLEKIRFRMKKKYIVEVPIKIFMYAFSLNKKFIEKKEYIWYKELLDSGKLYVKNLDAKKISVYLGKKLQKCYQEECGNLLKIDISDIARKIDEDKMIYNSISIKYEDYKEEIILPKILRQVTIQPYFQLKKDSNGLFIDSKLTGEGDLYLTVKDSEKKDCIIKDKRIKNGITRLSELNDTDVYNFYPYFLEEDYFENKRTELKEIRTGYINLENLVNCYIEFKKIDFGNEILEFNNNYSIIVNKKISKNKYQGTLKYKSLDNNKDIENVEIKVNPKGNQMEFSFKIYSNLDENWLTGYYDKKNKIILSEDNFPKEENRNYSRFILLDDEIMKIVINKSKIRRIK